jgi:hypothetical protein
MTIDDLLAELRRAWRRLLLGAVLGALLGVAAALVLPSWYRATVVVAPAADIAQGAGGLSSLASRFGGLASMAGIDLGAASTDREAITLETLRGHTFLVDFVRRRDLLVPLFAGRAFDAASRKWDIDPSVYDVADERWLKPDPDSGDPVPSDFKVHKRFSKRLYVDEDRRSGMIRISLEARSPVVAVEWINWLVADLNDYLRRKDIDEARRTIGFLEQQIRTTQVTEMQAIFYRLIEEQTKTLMLAQVRNEYALKVVDAPLVPDKPAQPNRVLLVALALLAGLALAALSVILRPMMRRRQVG